MPTPYHLGQGTRNPCGVLFPNERICRDGEKVRKSPRIEEAELHKLAFQNSLKIKDAPHSCLKTWECGDITDCLSKPVSKFLPGDRLGF